MTAKVITKENGTKYVPEAVNLKGFLAQNNMSGQISKLFFNTELINKYGIQKEQLKRDIANLTIDEQISKYANILIKWGHDQESGYTVTDAEADKKFDQVDPNVVNVYNWIFGLGIRERLPRATWDKIKKYAEYHDGGDGDQEWADDMGYFGASKYDLKGWAYSDEAIDILINEGLVVKFHDTQISSASQIVDILAKEREAKEKHFKQVNEKKEKANALYRRLLDFESEYMTAEDCENLAATKPKQIIIEEIGIDGHNIYGGGKYLLIDNNYLYIIQNNGHDGDDWSRNNYGTGGAGAIATRIKIDNTLTDWMIDVVDFTEDTNTFNADMKEQILMEKARKRYVNALKDTDFRSDLFDMDTAKCEQAWRSFHLSGCVSFGKVKFGYYQRSLALELKDDDFRFIFEKNEQRIAYFNSLLPEWFGKDIKGRFIVNKWVYFNVNQITPGCDIDFGAKYIFDEYVEGVLPVKYDKNKNIVLWSDGVITKNQFYNAYKPSCETLDKDTAFYLSISHTGINEMEILEQQFKPRVKIDGADPVKGFVYELYKVETGSENVYYLLDLTFYGYDDASTDYYLFRTEKEAKDAIKAYLK